MPLHRVLRPVDIPVALYLALYAGASYGDVAHDLDISPSTAHQAVKRLTYAGLANQTKDAPRRIHIAALLEFLEHGVRYAFPTQKQRPRRGVPTAHSGPVFEKNLDTDIEPVVWSTARGRTIGAAVEPLIESAPDLAQRCPEVYDLLTIVDAIRVGTARDREIANRLLKERLEATTIRSHGTDPSRREGDL